MAHLTASRLIIGDLFMMLASVFSYSCEILQMSELDDIIVIKFSHDFRNDAQP